MDKATFSKTSKIKCNYHLNESTKRTIDALHNETGIARGVILDVLIAQYGADIKRIFMKGEAQSVGASTYFAE